MNHELPEWQILFEGTTNASADDVLQGERTDAELLSDSREIEELQRIVAEISAPDMCSYTST